MNLASEAPDHAPRARVPVARGVAAAIDFGTSYTVAALCGADGLEVVDFGRGPRLPSAAALDDNGRLMVGWQAEGIAARNPGAFEAAPKRRIGTPSILLHNDVLVDVVEVVAAILRYVWAEVCRQAGGEPEVVGLTHPASWGRNRRSVLLEAAARAGIHDPVLLPEPVAAALEVSRRTVKLDDRVAVYDLGGGTFDTVVLHRTDNAFEPVGAGGGNDSIGGDVIDDLVVRTLGVQLDLVDKELWEQIQFDQSPGWRVAAGQLRRAARDVKEALSTLPTSTAYLPPPVDQPVALGQDEFEQLVGPLLTETVEELARTIAAAGETPESLAGIFRVGGSSRIPLIGRLLRDRLGVEGRTFGDPKAVVARGAARWAHGQIPTIRARRQHEEYEQQLVERNAAADADRKRVAEALAQERERAEAALAAAEAERQRAEQAKAEAKQAERERLEAQRERDRVAKELAAAAEAERQRAEQATAEAEQARADKEEHRNRLERERAERVRLLEGRKRTEAELLGQLAEDRNERRRLEAKRNSVAADFEYAETGYPQFTQYRVTELLGRSPRSAVYLANDVGRGQRVALKVVSGVNDLERFDRDCRLLADLAPVPNILAIRGSTLSTSGQPAIVMEYCEGGSLEEVLRARGPLSFYKVARYAVELAHALEAAHNHAPPVYHRRISPAHLLLRQSEVAVFASFAAGSAQLSPSTADGAPGSWRAYAAPESFAGAGEVSPVLCDIYALCATIYCLLTGAPPFGPNGASAWALGRIADGTSPTPSRLGRYDVPTDFERRSRRRSHDSTPDREDGQAGDPRQVAEAT